MHDMVDWIQRSCVKLYEIIIQSYKAIILCGKCASSHLSTSDDQCLKSLLVPFLTGIEGSRDGDFTKHVVVM